MARLTHDRGKAAVFLAILISVVTPARSRAQAVFTDLGAAPGATPGGTIPWSINNKGEVAGYFSDAKLNSHGFVWSGGQFTTVDIPGAASTMVRGNNDAGDVVGTYFTSLVAQGFRWSNGQVTPISAPGAFQTNPLGINNVGTIVGNYLTKNSKGLVETHGFVMGNGGFASLDGPGSTNTNAVGVNDAGNVVGYYVDSGGTYHGFIVAGGPLTTFDMPGAIATFPYRINNTGTIAGSAYTGLGGHGFIWSAGVFSTFAPPNSPYDVAEGLNDVGDVVGFYQAASGATLAYVASRVALVDPSSDLRDGSVVTTNTENLATKGRRVTGVAADGISRVVLRIPASTVGQSFTLSVLNDQQPAAPSQSVDEDGALGDIGGDALSHSDVTVTAVGTSAGAFAFAVYRAPIDFPRDAGQDAALASRTVSIRVQLSTGSIASVPITILRPPVVMIHGLWDDWTTWNSFSPLISGDSVDGRFSIGRLNYNAPVGKLIVSSTPKYSSSQLRRARANAFGFQFNAPSVLAQLQQWVEGFKAGANPLGIPVAAVQADVVAHSMGGNIARTLPLQPNFYGAATYGAGAIHKLVTIDTPHLGSTLATRLLSPQEEGGCLDRLLARHQSYVFRSAKLRGIGVVTGAISDLIDTPLSPALQLQSNVGIRTALIAGVYTNWASLDSSLSAFFVRHQPFGCPSDGLAGQLTSSGWPAVFGNSPNDGIVSERSQFAGFVGLGAEFSGVVHSKGAVDFGFAPPYLLALTEASEYVISLLNTPINHSAYRDLTSSF